MLGACTDGKDPSFSTRRESGNFSWKGWLEMKNGERILCRENYLKKVRMQKRGGHVERMLSSTSWLERGFRD